MGTSDWLEAAMRGHSMALSGLWAALLMMVFVGMVQGQDYSGTMQCSCDCASDCASGDPVTCDCPEPAYACAPGFTQVCPLSAGACPTGMSPMCPGGGAPPTTTTTTTAIPTTAGPTAAPGETQGCQCMPDFLIYWLQAVPAIHSADYACTCLPDAAML